MKIIIISLLVFLSSQTLYAQKKGKPDVFKYVKQDTSTAITADDLKTLARKMKEVSYALFRGKDKLDLDKQLKKLVEPDSVKRYRDAYDLSSAAMMMMGASQNKEMAIVLAAAPVEILPSNSFVVNNFSAILRMLDSTKIALPVLVYAKNIDPSSAIILTNLGNTVFELGDDRSAEVFFKRALKIDNHFRDARSSLVAVYLKRKDLGKAYEELMKGVEEVTYSENTKMELDHAANDDARKKQNQSSSQTPPPPAGPQGSSSSGNSGTGGTPDKLVLPPFPDWSNLKAFMAAKGPENWQKEVSKGFSACIKDMEGAGNKKAEKFKAILKLPSNEQQRAMDAIMNSPLAKMAERNEYAMDVMQQYMDDRFDKIMKDYKETEEKNGEKFTKSFEVVSDAYSKHSQALTSGTPEEVTKNIPAYKKLMVEYCRQTKRLTEDHYEDWKKNARIWHNRTNDALQEYWVYCEQYLNQVYADDFDRLTNKRMMYVYGKLSVLAGAYSIMPLGFLTTLTNASGDCPDATPEPVSSGGEADMTTTVPKKNGPPCPWENGGKAKAGAGPCSIALDCESIECECLEGVGGAVKWNFKKHETTITPLIGAKWEVGIHSGIETMRPLKLGELSVKAGVAITFDKKGQLVNDGVKALAEAGASINAGPLSIGGNVQLNYAAVAGLDSEFTYELAASR